MLPATLEIVYADGTDTRVQLPVETWQRVREIVVKVPGAKAVRSATIDPDHVLPDEDRGNNTLAVSTVR